MPFHIQPPGRKPQAKENDWEIIPVVFQRYPGGEWRFSGVVER